MVLTGFSANLLPVRIPDLGQFRVTFDRSPAVFRYFFGICSLAAEAPPKDSRTAYEQYPYQDRSWYKEGSNQSRTPVEQFPKNSRTVSEQFPKRTRRTGLFFRRVMKKKRAFWLISRTKCMFFRSRTLERHCFLLRPK